MPRLKRIIAIVSMATGMAFSSPGAAQATDWEPNEALEPCFTSDGTDEGVAAALAKCRELLGSARYGGEDAAMLRYAIINFESRTLTVDEQVERLTSLTRESLPVNYRYQRDALLAGICYDAKKWACVVDAIRPDLRSNYLAMSELTMFAEAMTETQGVAAVETLASELIQQDTQSAVGYLLRADARKQGGDKAGAAGDLVTAGARMRSDYADGQNHVCWRLVTELGAADKARDACDAAVLANPLNWAVWDSHGAMNLALGENGKAWQSYELAVRLDEKAASALYGRGLAWERYGNPEKAREDKAAALAIDPDVAKDYEGYGI